MRTALIGYTGFVGSNLLSQYPFTDTYNSRSIPSIQGQSFDLVVCAGIQAKKWWANQNPTEDLQGITALLTHLAHVHAKEFILISTVDVYHSPFQVNEETDCDTLKNHAYGTHRRFAEQEILHLFPHAKIVRLPALFGNHLKKNVIFDLLTDNCLEMINPASSFQYYPLTRLWSDISTVRESTASLINLVTPPIQTSQIIETFFPEKIVGTQASPEVHYDVQTLHNNLFHTSSPYIMERNDVFTHLSSFITSFPSQ